MEHKIWPHQCSSCGKEEEENHHMIRTSKKMKRKTGSVIKTTTNRPYDSHPTSHQAHAPPDDAAARHAHVRASPTRRPIWSIYVRLGLRGQKNTLQWDETHFVECFFCQREPTSKPTLWIFGLILSKTTNVARATCSLFFEKTENTIFKFFKKNWN
jgi:hypothetical protein